MNRTKKNSPKHIRCQVDILSAFRAVHATKGRRGRPRDRDHGKEAMADWYDVSYQAVCNWFDGDRPRGLPTGYQYRTHLWAVAHGYVLHPEVFGYLSDGRPVSTQASAIAT
jgi:hypothetical protein